MDANLYRLDTDERLATSYIGEKNQEYYNTSSMVESSGFMLKPNYDAI